MTDEALTQCIRTLRRLLGDNVAKPRFIETVPKHGYRFIATVEQAEDGDAIVSTEAPLYSWRQCLLLAAAGTTGAGVAGIFGGLFYGFIGASQPLLDEGAISMLLVLICLNVVVALTGGAGVSFGIAASGLLPGRRWRWEGVLLGGAVGSGIWLGSRGTQMRWTRRSVIAAAIAGGAAGCLIPLLGGRLMGGSLDLLARNFPHSRLRMGQIGAALGEQGFGPISHVVTGCLEGALFGACIVGAMIVLSPLLLAAGAHTTSSNPLSPPSASSR